MKSAAQEQINAAYSMGASYVQVIRHVILPLVKPGSPAITRHLTPDSG